MKCPPSFERIRSIKISKRKTQRHEKAKIIIFRSVGFPDCFVRLKRYSKFAQNRSENKLVRENAVEVARSRVWAPGSN